MRTLTQKQTQTQTQTQTQNIKKLLSSPLVTSKQELECVYAEKDGKTYLQDLIFRGGDLDKRFTKHFP